MTGGSRILLAALLTAGLASPALAGDVVVQPTAGDAFVVKNSSGTIERLRVDEATGNVSKDGTLFLHAKGAYNTCVGADAGAAVTSGDKNAAFGYHALTANTTGASNAAFGYEALAANQGGLSNSAFGRTALVANTSGGNNAAFGLGALGNNTTGSGNAAFGSGALVGNPAASGTSNNSAFGSNALFANQADGNSAFGANALSANTTGVRNTAVGYTALSVSTSGEDNVGVGSQALAASTGSRNTVVGSAALDSGSGTENTALGAYTLRSTTGNGNVALGGGALYSLGAGSNNVAIGDAAGVLLASGNNNIMIGTLAADSMDSGSNNIIIGSDRTNGNDRIAIGGSQTSTSIAGIHGAAVDGVTDLPVSVDAYGKLGTTTSSIRFKEAVRDMGDASAVLARMRPVSFRYKQGYAIGEGATRYGLIAEEVAEIAPDLVVFDDSGEPYAVKYQFLAPMLLNEFQKQQRTIEAQRDVIEEQGLALARLSAQVEALATQLATAPAGARP